MIILENDFLKVKFNQYGASITSLFVKKVKRDVIYGYKDKTKYKNNELYFGCIVGRSSGRIENAEIDIDNKTYQLTNNYLNKHNLHGGSGISNKKFNYVIEDKKVIFNIKLDHLEDGFIGNIDLTIIYTLNKNQLIMETKGTSDRLSYLNITNHSSFNLNQEKYKNILSHNLYINSSKYIEVNDEMIPHKISEVSNTFNFKKLKQIKKDLSFLNPQIKIANGYDHAFILNSTNLNDKALSLKVDDLTLNLYTNNKSVVIYTGNYLEEGIKTNVNQTYKNGSIAIEAQGIPNNQKFDEYKLDNLIDISKPYDKITIWEFI